MCIEVPFTTAPPEEVIDVPVDTAEQEEILETVTAQCSFAINISHDGRGDKEYDTVIVYSHICW